MLANFGNIFDKIDSDICRINLPKLSKFANTVANFDMHRQTFVKLSKSRHMRQTFVNFTQRRRNILSTIVKTFGSEQCRSAKNIVDLKELQYKFKIKFLFARLGCDTGENEPSKVWYKGLTFYLYLSWIPHLQAWLVGCRETLFVSTTSIFFAIPTKNIENR